MASKPAPKSYYLRKIATLKDAAAKIERAAEKRFHLPSGSVHILITKLAPATRARIIGNAK